MCMDRMLLLPSPTESLFHALLDLAFLAAQVRLSKPTFTLIGMRVNSETCPSFIHVVQADTARLQAQLAVSMVKTLPQSAQAGLVFLLQI
jgi:hypothetical protein